MNSAEAAREVNEIARSVGDDRAAKLLAKDLADVLKATDPDEQLRKSEERLVRSKTEVVELRRELSAANARADAASAELIKTRSMNSMLAQRLEGVPDVETAIRAANDRAAKADRRAVAADARAVVAENRASQLAAKVRQERREDRIEMTAAISKACADVAVEVAELRRRAAYAESESRRTAEYRDRFDTLDSDEIQKLERIVKEARALKLAQKNFQDRGGNA